MHRDSYVIVGWPGPGRRVQIPSHRPGRHRLGSPGRAARQTGRQTAGWSTGWSARRRPLSLRRGRHRRAARPSALAARYGTLVVLLGTVTVSGWFAAGGAAAFAQMVQP